MGKEEKDYSEMSRSELEKIVKDKVHKMEHKERSEHTPDLIRGYHSGVRDAEYNAIFAVIKSGDKAGEMTKVYKTLHDEHQKKNGDLEETVITDWLKKFADAMLPALGMGAKGKTQQNYNTLIVYLNDFERIKGGKSKIIEQIRTAIRKGDGFKASGLILDAMEQVHRQNDLNDFMNILIPADHGEFRQYAADFLAKEATKHLSAEEKKKYKISPGLIGEDLVNMYISYSHHEYKALIDAAKVNIKKRKS